MEQNFQLNLIARLISSRLPCTYAANLLLYCETSSTPRVNEQKESDHTI